MCADERRRLDRALASDYLKDLGDLPTDELRRRRAECAEEEDILSYCRRLLHGKLDILRAELEARENRDQLAGDHLVERLTTILSEGPGTPGRGGRSRMSAKALDDLGRRRVERVVSESHLVRLPDLSQEEVEQVVEDLVAEERRVSSERRRLHEVIDALQAELVRRYREGEAPPPGIIGSGRT